MERIALLGATGSIGTSTVDVVSRYPERFSIEAVAAGSNYENWLKLPPLSFSLRRDCG